MFFANKFPWVVDEIKKRGGQAIAVQGDVARKTDIERLFAATNKAFGRLDILVNNAGVYQFAPLEEVTHNEFHREFNTNVLGLILATQEATKYFGAEGGSVINVGSVASSVTPPASVIYTATKGAVDAVTRVLAKELGPRKIRVNSINPGAVETEGYRAIIQKSGLTAYVASAGVNGALMLYPQEIRNYRDWTKIDVDLWRHYWFAMVNRGVLAQPYWWDEQWTISVQHSEADIDQHLAAAAIDGANRHKSSLVQACS